MASSLGPFWIHSLAIFIEGLLSTSYQAECFTHLILIYLNLSINPSLILCRKRNQGLGKLEHLPKVKQLISTWLSENSTLRLSNTKVHTCRHYTHTDHLVHGRNWDNQVCNSQTLKTPHTHTQNTHQKTPQITHILKASWARLCDSHLSLTTPQ